MGSPDDKKRHSKRLKQKRKASSRKAALRDGVSKKRERVRSEIAKDLIVSGKYKQRIVKDKRGKKYDLNKMNHYDLVQAIQEIEDYGDE